MTTSEAIQHRKMKTFLRGTIGSKNQKHLHYKIDSFSANDDLNLKPTEKVD